VSFKWNSSSTKHLAVVALAITLAAAAACQAQAASFDGIEYVGRWTGPDNARVASYGGSAVLYKFRNSSTLRVDLTAKAPVKGVAPASKLYIRVIVDGGAPARFALDRTDHPGYLLADGLSKAAHTVELRYDQEPLFGALQVGHAALDEGGAWEQFTDARPIVEIIDDSDATGICILGPTSTAKPANLLNSDWSSQLLSWPALLESGLAAIGHPAVVIDLALSGSTAASEAKTYDQAAPLLDQSKFTAYSSGRHPSLVLFWGGSNDKGTGGELATGTLVTYANLSPFERGIYDQIIKVTAQNPEAQLGMLEYSDPNLPHWTPAYMQIKALLPTDIQKKMHFLAVKDAPEHFNACDAAPNGHPDLTTQETWTAQILHWIVTEDLL
jgi:hypothetical protein